MYKPTIVFGDSDFLRDEFKRHPDWELHSVVYQEKGNRFIVIWKDNHVSDDRDSIDQCEKASEC